MAEPLGTIRTYSLATLNGYGRNTSIVQPGGAGYGVGSNVPPTVTMTATVTVANEPGTITLAATASDGDGSIASVQFFNSTALLATVTQPPYAYTWSNVAAGTYSLTARATDNRGAATTTQASLITKSPGVPKVYFVYVDQINTPREITNSAGELVWRADLTEPFGANLPNETPTGGGNFIYNLCFPGQYFDKETGLHYNYFRDYDPQIGRYVESDPIGVSVKPAPSGLGNRLRA